MVITRKVTKKLAVNVTHAPGSWTGNHSAFQASTLSAGKNSARNSSSVFLVLVTAFRLSWMLSASTVPLKGGLARHMVYFPLIWFCLDTLSL